MANDIKLGTRSNPLSEDLKNVSVGGERSSLEISSIDNGARVRGDLESTGDLTSPTASINAIKTNSITSAGLTIDDTDNIVLDADGGEVSIKDGGTEWCKFTNSNSEIRLNENGGASSDDYFYIQCKANGATDLVTIEDGGSAGADLTLDIDGDITLDSSTGVFIAKNAGTEFSVAGSSYAGTILGYRTEGINSTHATYSLTTSYAVPNSNMTVRFIAPPSGVVEVEVQIGFDSGTSSNRIVYFGLSDNATYNALESYYEQAVWKTDETDDVTITHKWVISGLTAGDTYNYWFGAKVSATSGTPKLQWGGSSANRFQDFIMKVTALPTATLGFAVYG